DERHRALVEGDALAENGQPTTNQLETAYRLDVGDGAGQLYASAQFRIKTTSAHEDACRRVDADIEAQNAGARVWCWRAVIGTRTGKRFLHGARGVAVDHVDCRCIAAERVRNRDFRAFHGKFSSE